MLNTSPFRDIEVCSECQFIVLFDNKARPHSGECTLAPVGLVHGLSPNEAAQADRINYWRQPEATAEPYDLIDEPDHYHWHPRVTAADLASEFGYNIGTAITYLFRCGRKPDNEAVQELRKVIRHCQFEVNKLEGRKPSDPYPYDS